MHLQEVVQVLVCLASSKRLALPVSLESMVRLVPE